MLIPTKPIASISRPSELLETLKKCHNGETSVDEVSNAYNLALEGTVKRFEVTASFIDTSTGRDITFAKIETRLKGIQLASEQLKI